MKHPLILLLAAAVLLVLLYRGCAPGEPPLSLHDRLLSESPRALAESARAVGDPRRGAVLFHLPRLLCSRCHTADGESALGPDLPRTLAERDDQFLVESLLVPAHESHESCRQVRLVLLDGSVASGIVVAETDAEISLLIGESSSDRVSVDIGRVAGVIADATATLPDLLTSQLSTRVQFLDLLSYLLDIRDGGPDRAKELQPTTSGTLLWNPAIISGGKYVIEDGVDHSTLLRSLNDASLERGRVIYHRICQGCHGVDGVTATLPRAPSFGTSPLRYGVDPYSLYRTLSLGNGHMGPQTWMRPEERYDVIHYIRDTFMRRYRQDFQEITPAYLNRFPAMATSRAQRRQVQRDFGPALASALTERFGAALTIRLDESTSVAYDLHTMNLAGLWRGGFLDLSETNHQRLRGEGLPRPVGHRIPALEAWRWAHDGEFDSALADKPERGPLPEKWLRYRGHYLHGDRVVLSYEIDGRQVLETPSLERRLAVVGHTLTIGPGAALKVAVARHSGDGDRFAQVIALVSGARLGAAGSATGTVAVCGSEVADELVDFVAAAACGDTDGLQWQVDEQRRLVLTIPPASETSTIEILLHVGFQGHLEPFADFVTTISEVTDLRDLIRGGPPRWNQKLHTRGDPGTGDGPYVVDTITIPDVNPWNSWLRTSAIDFFPDGRIVFVTIGGDVWVGDGIDSGLERLTWQRHAAGLHEPLGVKVIDGQIYVTCKDRITRLHDLNADGEADFYESFHADADVSPYFHAYNFDLVADSTGHLYYAKTGQYTNYSLPGAVIRVSPDGAQGNVVCTGLRVPNGLGVLPGDLITFSDNEGNWIPASKITIAKVGGFHGYVPNQYGLSGTGIEWAPDGDPARALAELAPATFDPPICWLPRDVDNSSGGQLWVDDERWGPLSGHLIHTSFGQRSMMRLMIQEVGGVRQASAVRLPFLFGPGIMRARVNPRDGQVYVTGLSGWGSGLPKDMEGGIQRLRYTGEPLHMLESASVVPGGLRLRFNFEIDTEDAAIRDNYHAAAWNYRWSEDYGSPHYSPSTREIGRDVWPIASARPGADRRSVLLALPEIRPVDQLNLRLTVRSASGSPFTEDVYMTIHRVPE